MIEEPRAETVDAIVDGDAATHLEALGLDGDRAAGSKPGRPRASRSSSSASTSGCRGP